MNSNAALNRVSQGYSFRAAAIILTDGEASNGGTTPTTLNELQANANWNAINNYIGTLVGWFATKTNNRATLSFDVTDSDLGCGVVGGCQTNAPTKAPTKAPTNAGAVPTKAPTNAGAVPTKAPTPPPTYHHYEVTQTVTYTG